MDKHHYCHQILYSVLTYEGVEYLVSGTPDRVLVGDSLLAVTWKTGTLPYTAITMKQVNNGIKRAVKAIPAPIDDPLPRMRIHISKLYEIAGTVTAVSLVAGTNLCSVTLQLWYDPETKNDSKSFRYDHVSGQGYPPYQDVRIVNNHELVQDRTIHILIPDDFSKNPRMMPVEDIDNYHENIARRITHGFTYRPE